jgi:hypothetical protein
VHDPVGAAPCYSTMEVAFSQNTTNKSEYMLKTAIRLGTKSSTNRYVVSYLIPKLPKDINVTLDAEYSYDYYDDTRFTHDEFASIIGKWRLTIGRSSGFMFSPVIVDYSQYNIVYEFKEEGILIISAKTGAPTFPDVGEHLYSIVDNEYGFPGLPYGLKIGNWESWYQISSERMIIDDSPVDGGVMYFVRIN